MTEVTKCPKCHTRFKVTAAQLDAHEGLVRCGHCHDIFDASKHLHDDEPSPQLSLPIDEPQPGEFDLAPIPNIPELETEPTTLAQQVQFVEELTDEVLETPPRKGGWLGTTLAVLLTLMFLAQATYYFRVEITTRLPGLKPLLSEYCTLLDCTVALPQKADLIVIESSELESNPDQGNVVTLHALVHNRASFAQAYPSLELTLTDLQDQALARRVFRPADYLKTGEDEKLGVPANRDLDIKLHLDTTDLKPSGYRLFLFYPK
jgi:predicted Zn finger-like uncharacterized protein